MQPCPVLLDSDASPDDGVEVPSDVVIAATAVVAEVVPMLRGVNDLQVADRVVIGR